jgi:hypothetical protein
MKSTLSAVLLLLAACGGETAGELVEIDLSIQVQGQDDLPVGTFETETGFRVVLEEARLGLSSIMVYAQQEQAFKLSDLFLGHALAHGGYDPFNGKRVRVEYAEPVIVDLLDTAPKELGSVEAEAGAMESATLIFAELAGRSAQAYVRGTATQGDDVIPFEGELTLPDERLLRRVDGIPIQGSISALGELRVSIRPHLFFDEAHFERLEGADTRQLTADTQVHTSWVFGIRSTKTYEAEWNK